MQSEFSAVSLKTYGFGFWNLAKSWPMTLAVRQQGRSVDTAPLFWPFWTNNIRLLEFCWNFSDFEQMRTKFSDVSLKTHGFRFWNLAKSWPMALVVRQQGRNRDTAPLIWPFGTDNIRSLDFCWNFSDFEPMRTEFSAVSLKTHGFGFWNLAKSWPMEWVIRQQGHSVDTAPLFWPFGTNNTRSLDFCWNFSGFWPMRADFSAVSLNSHRFGIWNLAKSGPMVYIIRQQGHIILLCWSFYIDIARLLVFFS